MATVSYRRDADRTYLQHHADAHAAAPWRDAMWLVARLVLGGLFVTGGAQKFMGLEGFAGSLVQGGFSEETATMLAPLAAGIEMLMGLGIALGLLTRYAAALACAFVVAASFTAHRFWELEGQEQMMQMIQFNKNLMILAGLTFLLVGGGRRFSLDHWRGGA